MAPPPIPANQIGGSTPPLTTTYRVLKARRRWSYHWAIIERTRRQTVLGAAYAQVAYAVVRDWKPILATSTATQLLSLDAVRVMKFRRQRWCKARTAGAWHGSLSDAEAKFQRPPKR